MKASIPELKSYVNSIVTLTKMSNLTFTATRNNIVELLDKIGKIFTVDACVVVDKLAKFDGEYLSYGKTIEEWQADLKLPQSYASIANAEDCLKQYYNTFRPVAYSYTLGRQYIPQSFPNDNIERAVHDEGEFQEVVAMLAKRLDDSMVAYRYTAKRQMIAKIIELAVYETTASNATLFVASTAYATVNTLLKNASNVVGILVKAYGANDAADWNAAVAGGWIIPLDLVEVLAKPVDSTTGEAFIESLKTAVEVASDMSEGHSFNGNTLSGNTGLTLFVKQGIMPSLDVNTLAGAFHLDKLDAGVDIIPLPDFGNADSKYYAVLIDNRGMRLHNTYNATRENFNGLLDHLNVFRHTEDTAWISRNTFVKVYAAS